MSVAAHGLATVRILGVAGLVFALFGCGSERSGEGAAEDLPGPSCEGTIESIQTEIFATSCADALCHGGDAPAAGLDLSGDDPAASMVGVASGTCDGWERVAPGSLEDSLLWHKVYSAQPPCGAPMPVGSHLAALELDCLREWILSATPPPEKPGCESCGTPACVDLAADNAHCGTCSNACPAGSVCVDGSCECGMNLEACGGACVDLETARDHCGSCDAACPASAICNVGQCVCPAGLVQCGDRCVDPASDPSHCGGCDNACSADASVCLLGACAEGCGELAQCGQACVDVQSSPLHCGDCDRACPTGAACVAGACQCPAGTSDCGGVCLNTYSDPNNCGGCGATCGGSQICAEGACRCPGGGSVCAGTCVDLDSDVQNCGACGAACGAGQSCRDGRCECGGGNAVSFGTDVQPILTQNCATRGCHSGRMPQEGLDLSSGQSFDDLVGVSATQCGSRKRVVAGDPASSYLMQKLLGVDLCSGSQMPKAGMGLPQVELDIIGGWICQGALDN